MRVSRFKNQNFLLIVKSIHASWLSKTISSCWPFSMEKGKSEDNQLVRSDFQECADEITVQTNSANPNIIENINSLSPNQQANNFNEHIDDNDINYISIEFDTSLVHYYEENINKIIVKGDSTNAHTYENVNQPHTYENDTLNRSFIEDSTDLNIYESINPLVPSIADSEDYLCPISNYLIDHHPSSFIDSPDSHIYESIDNLSIPLSFNNKILAEIEPADSKNSEDDDFYNLFLRSRPMQPLPDDCEAYEVYDSFDSSEHTLYEIIDLEHSKSEEDDNCYQEGYSSLKSDAANEFYSYIDNFSSDKLYSDKVSSYDNPEYLNVANIHRDDDKQMCLYGN